MTFAEYGFGGSDSSTAAKMAMAGYRGANATRVFVGARTLLSVVPALLVLVPQIAAGRPIGKTLYLAGAVGLFGHLLANAWLNRRARGRVRQLSRSLPDALDLMVVCLEAGLGLNATIARVGHERGTMNDPLGAEFDQVALEIRGGRTREDALRALGERNGLDDLKALAALVIQSDRMGASMANTLRVHADLLRTKRRQRAEEAARKLPIRMLFPLALFILPALFIVVGGPAFLTFRTFIRMMTHR
jgi:tight adherence protein C